jgi:hypothetical protein
MNRPAWVEMIGGILSNGIRTIIVEKLDRLARDLMIQEHIIQDLGKRGIKLISVTEPDLCSDDHPQADAPDHGGDFRVRQIHDRLKIAWRAAA